MSKKHEPGMAYDMKKLNKLFFFLSIVFLLSVIWMFVDDFIRPWKAVQIQSMQIKRQKIEDQIQKVQSAMDKDKLAQLKNDLNKAQEKVVSRKNDIKVIDKKIDAVDVKIKDETIINGQLNSNVAGTNFSWEQAHSHGYKSEDKLFRKLKQFKKEFAESKDRLKAYTSEIKAHKNARAQLRKEIIAIEKEIKEITSTLDLLKLAKSKTDMNPIFLVRNAPLADFLDPTLKIQQVVAKNLTDDRYFQQVAKVDRCMTCHTFIDQKGYEDQKNPFKTHPNLDLMVGIKSPHPMKTVGCTTCHGGEGHRVLDFSAAAHTPRNKEQEKEWIEKYHWHAPHKVPKIMYKVGQTEAGCINCHKGVEFIPGANVVNEGRRNMEKFGCYGCHKIEGWEHKRKPGPSLEKIASKVSKDFFKNWVWSPRSFNKHANMPAFFNQDNNKKPEFTRKNITEVNAIAEFIWSKSKDYKPIYSYTGGNKEKGKALIRSVGCMGCHGVEGFEEESDKINAYAGPYLTATGSKVKNPDWLVTWLRKPSHYQEDTIMPSFRLSDREANDIASYLLSLKNKKFDSLKFEPIDEKLRDDLLLEYFSAFDTFEVAKNKVDGMSDHAKTLELGSRSIGKYGCYSCHNIEGFEGRAPIGPELTKVGSKPLTQFGFSHEYDVEHSRDGWIKAHLLNPRRWDNGIDKPFKDILRMPNFYMTERQAETITVALIGQVGDYIPLAGVKRLNAHEKITAEGMKVVNKYNCAGCHKIDGDRGDISKIFEDDGNEGPPWLVSQGHRVQPDWFHYFLANVYPIRPWLKIRMPSFNLNNDERNSIVSMFQHKAEQKTFEDNHAEISWAPGEREAARELFKKLDCTSCHTTGFTNDEPSAPNLHMAKRRLRPSWIKKWLSNPQAILEYTPMPNFWEDGQSQETDILGGDPEKQREALTKYIMEIGQEKLPNARF